MTLGGWTFTLSAATVIGAVLFLAAAIWFAARGWRVEGGGWDRKAILLVRLLLATLLAITLLRPERIAEIRHTIQPRVVVLWDASGSMATRDVAAGDRSAVTRAQWVESQVDRQFWKDLEERYTVDVVDFARPPGADAKPGELTAAGSDIATPLRDALQRHTDLRAVVLLTDGDWNLGASPVSAATALAQRQVPVFCAAVGSDSFLPDIELSAVSAPSYGLVTERISIMVTVQNRLPRSLRTSVEIRGPGGANAAKQLLLPAMAQVQESLLLTPMSEGEGEYTVRVPVEADEAFADNNEKTFRMAVRREILRVLLIDAAPRWEYRYLRNALARDRGVDLSCLLWHPRLAAGQGRYYIRSFPEEKDEISEFDVLFLGDVGVEEGMLTPENVAMIRGLIEQQGSGLVFLPGPAGRQNSFLETELAEMLPVELDPVNAGGFAAPDESPLELTAHGRDHWLTMLASTPEANERVWRGLPGFYWHAPVVRAKPGCDVLAVHGVASNKHGRIPLLVTRPFGRGKVLYMGIDSAWRWRRGVEDTYHYRFWGQVVRWMAHQRHLAQGEGVRCFYSPEAPKRGDRVVINATVFDPLGLPLTEGKVLARIVSPSEVESSLDLAPSEGGWGVYTGSFTPEEGGSYEIEIRCDTAGRSLSTKLDVVAPTVEKIGRPSRGAVLREIANLTGGECVDTEGLDDLVKSVQILPEARPEERRLRLWCHPVWCALLLGLLAIYWAGRKLTGLA